ncbi:hypothetical protein GOP47_0023584 [Adiantum capillus-veneris]|uniref:Metaxin n=1 Tax=Adiantum capillus-veneris TaxID=13818 RepID=A0A9D4U5Y6_ADICA|nr:hypothetical protein GOP47_0023584 [Adiantum capillus-veneris]
MADPSSSSRSDGRDLVLLARGPAWGLPTACPFCLPSYIYLKLARLDFSITYNNVSPDADYLPAVEYGDLVGYSTQSGGIIGFLERQGIANLDAGLLDNEVALMRSLSAMIWMHLHSMLLCELWDLDNVKVARQIYFASLPWPLSKILYWKQQVCMWNHLGLRKDNIALMNQEMEVKATQAYDTLSTLLGDQKFFLSSGPSSLDALFLSHALFVMKAPLENSHLKEELYRHPNLVRFAESLQRGFLEAKGPDPIARSVHVNPPRHPSAPLRRQEKVQRTEKMTNFKWRAKWFFTAQAVAVLAFLYIWGVSEIQEAALDDATLDDVSGENSNNLES